MSRVLDELALEGNLQAVTRHVHNEALLVGSIVGVVAADGRGLLANTLHQSTSEASPSEQYTRVGAVQIVVVQVLHHEKCFAIVLVRRHHNVIVQGLGNVLEGRHE